MEKKELTELEKSILKSIVDAYLENDEIGEEDCNYALKKMQIDEVDLND